MPDRGTTVDSWPPNGPQSLHPDIEKLLAIQRVDQKIAHIRKDLLSLPKEQEKRKKRLDGLLAEADASAKELQSAEVRSKENELNIKQSDDEVKKLQERLNTVKNNAEYQATLLQIQSVRDDRSRVEEEGLGLIDQIETLRASAGEKRAAAEAEQKVYDEFLTEAEKLRQDRESKAAEVSTGRDELLAGIKPDLLASYERMFEFRNGMAVVEVEGSTCMGCYTSVPPNLMVRLQAGTAVVNCHSCQRYLYVQE